MNALLDVLMGLLEQLRPAFLGKLPDYASALLVPIFGAAGAFVVRLFRRRSATGEESKAVGLLDVRSNAISVAPINEVSLLRKVYDFDEFSYRDHGGNSVENIPYAQFLEWWQAYPNGFLCGFRKNQPISVVGIFPITREWAEKFMRREFNERDLTAEVIKKSSGKIYYASGISTCLKMSGLSKHLPSLLFPAILEWARLHREQFGHEEIEIISEGSSEIGQKLLTYVTFTLESPAMGADQRPRYRKFTSLQKIKRFLTEDPLAKLNADSCARAATLIE